MRQGEWRSHVHGGLRLDVLQLFGTRLIGSRGSIGPCGDDAIACEPRLPFAIEQPAFPTSSRLTSHWRWTCAALREPIACAKGCLVAHLIAESQPIVTYEEVEN